MNDGEVYEVLMIDRWPFWLSPRQAIVIPVAGAHSEYAEATAKRLRHAGFHVTTDLTDKKMQKKVRRSRDDDVRLTTIIRSERLNWHITITSSSSANKRCPRTP